MLRLLVVSMWSIAAAVAQEPPPRPAATSAHGHAHDPVAEAGALRLLGVRLSLLGAAGASTEREAVLADLKGGAHDPDQRGFTFQQAELSMAGALDEWLEGRAVLVAALGADDGETVVELEEAYVTTQQLPFDLRLKAGTFFTAVGRRNAQHPHEWHWHDQPVVHTRLFGGDGMRGPGAQLDWSPGGWQFVLGAQNADGETMTGFLASEEVYDERAIGGRAFTGREVRSGGDLVWSLRAAHTASLGAAQTVGLGVSALLGPNATGNSARTTVLGGDVSWRWQPDPDRDHLFVQVQAEYLVRAFDAAEQQDTSDPGNPLTVPGDTLRDYGGFVELFGGFAEGWSAGVRVDQASGVGAGYDAANRTMVDRRVDPLRADRLRVSPLLVYAPSPFSRVRLQYDYDDSDHLDGPAHSLWLGFVVQIGAGDGHAH